VFGRLYQSQPNFSRKIIPVVGDVSVDGLGLSDADRRKLEKNVSVVIHSAATLNFMEPLKSVTQIFLCFCFFPAVLVAEWLEALMKQSYQQMSRSNYDEDMPFNTLAKS